MMIHPLMTMIISSSQLFELCKAFLVPNEDLMILFLDMLLFIETEKASIKGCSRLFGGQFNIWSTFIPLEVGVN
jgi:hypothetical protein